MSLNSMATGFPTLPSIAIYTVHCDNEASTLWFCDILFLVSALALGLSPTKLLLGLTADGIPRT
jgi:hypothetical protein